MKMVIALLLIVGMFLPSVQANAEDIMYIVGYPDTFLRADPSTKNPYLARMPHGSAVTVLSEETDGWCLVEYYGQQGYCMREFLHEDDPYILYEPHPESAEEAFSDHLLRRGNRYPDYRVMNLQMCLIQGGYLSDEPGADGLFGRRTKAALSEFQKEHDLDPDGIAGDLTKEALWDEYCDLLMEIGCKR